MTAAVTLFTILVLYRLLFVYNKDTREPRLIKPRFPLIGHAINIYRHGSRHFVGIAKKYGLPIFLLPVPSGRIAIVTTPELLSHVDKNPKAIAFAPIAALVINKLSGLSKSGSKVVLDKLMGEDKMEGYMNAIMKDIHMTLAPGPHLETITTQVAHNINGSIQRLYGKTTRLNLLNWFRHEFGLSSTNGIYGPENPFKDPKVEAGFWAFNDNISDLLITPTIDETFRHRTCGISSRYVTEDVTLKSQYLLKKGTIMELPNNALHSNPEYWGETVNEFNPRRFLVNPRSAEAKAARGAFRPFGGGASLCAGRHQAMSQMLGALALFIMSSDCYPVSGEWKFPGAHGHTIAAAADLPSTDLWLNVKPRKGYKADYWRLDPESKE